MDTALNPLQQKAEPDGRIAEMMKTEKACAVAQVRALVQGCQLTEQDVFPALPAAPR